MAATPGKTIALILLIVFIILAAIQLTPFFLAPFGWVTGISHIFRIPRLDFMHIDTGFIRFTTVSFFSLILLVFWIAVIVWVYRDAERRNMNGILWALLVLIGNLIGLLIYLILRNDNSLAPPLGARTQTATKPCPSCGKPVDINAVYCSQCGAKLEKTCPECHKPVDSTWKLCPHCGCKL
jgi:hypothetical protein